MEVTQIDISGTTVNKTDNTSCWRLVHNGEKVITLFSGAGITQSTHTIFLANTYEECQTQIYTLNLEYNP